MNIIINLNRNVNVINIIDKSEIQSTLLTVIIQYSVVIMTLTEVSCLSVNNEEIANKQANNAGHFYVCLL